MNHINIMNRGTEMTEQKQNKPSFFQKQFSKIEDKETALKFAKEGAVAGLILCLMEAGGLAFAYFGRDPSTGGVFNQDAFNAMLMGAIILLPVLLFLCWRIKIGKGYISAILLFCLFLFEILNKFANGTTNVGWLIVYFYIGLGLINGARACWYLRKLRTAELEA